MTRARSHAAAGAGRPTGLGAVAPVPLVVSRFTGGLRLQRAADTQAQPAEGRDAAEPPALLVEDDAGELAPGQMRRSAFLAALRPAVCATAEDALRGTRWSTAGCPWIDRWFSYYEGRSAAQIERALRKYAPEASGAGAAAETIPLLARRVRRSIVTWSETGRVTDVPEGMLDALSGGGVLGVLGRAAAGVAGAVASVAGTVGHALSSLGRLFRWERDDAAAEGGSRATAAQAGPALATREALGPGTSLDAGVRARMETVLGHDFARVRIHADAPAAALARDLDARAFTVGEHVAFGPREYRPGEPVGDAVLAHELAHVAQQEGGAAAAGALPDSGGGGDDESLEVDADRVAAGAVLALHGKTPPAPVRRRAGSGPRQRSGLRLSRCGGSLPALRDPRELLRERDAATVAWPREVREMAQADAKQAKDPERQTALQEAGERTAYNIETALDFLYDEFQKELADAGQNDTRKKEAQKRYLDQVERLRGSYRKLYRLQAKWGFDFIFGAVQTNFQQGKPELTRRKYMLWSSDELDKVDQLLDRIPPAYLKRVKHVLRQGEGTFSAAASWDEKLSTMSIFDLAFKQPDLFLRSFLHEVGHSTDPERKVDSFRLPAAEWMKLSDWRTSTADSLATDLGIGDDAVNKLLATFKEQKRSSSNMTERWPIKVNGRMVTFYKYQAGTKEDPLSLSLDLFVHYDAKRDEQFVSRYARLDPMEDLAESFAVYLLEPGKTQ
ncbi:MAG TPA: DUF4157 domain-containing protein, partial [Myxococcota bacterium]|nr:DUF4157 domain-containing protein [Myxococcota bacterium]